MVDFLGFNTKKTKDGLTFLKSLVHIKEVRFQQSYPFIAPVGGFYNVDFVGDEINKEGQTIIDVPLEVNDEQALRTFYIFNGDISLKVKALLDTGSQRSQISSKVADRLKLYDADKSDAGTIFVNGNQYEVYSTIIDVVVYLKELLKDDPYKKKVNSDHHIGEKIEVVFQKTRL